MDNTQFTVKDLNIRWVMSSLTRSRDADVAVGLPSYHTQPWWEVPLALMQCNGRGWTFLWVGWIESFGVLLWSPLHHEWNIWFHKSLVYQFMFKGPKCSIFRSYHSHEHNCFVKEVSSQSGFIWWVGINRIWQQRE